MTNIGEVVHIIPLGHEIDRAIAPFLKRKADRVYVLAIPENTDLDPVMTQKQFFFLRKVMQRFNELGIPAEYRPVNMFNVLDVLKEVSFLIRKEKDQGNTVYVNMSSCGRQTSIPVTMAAMVHEVNAYYVKADRYATGELSSLESEHGLSIVEDVRTDWIFNFKIMMPKRESVKFLVELYKRSEQGINEMSSSDIIRFFHKEGVPGFDKLPEEKPRYEAAKQNRILLNRTTRGYLKDLEDIGYIEKKWRGREFYITITKGGEHIACVSGIIGKEHAALV